MVELDGAGALEKTRIWIDTDPALGVVIDGRPRDIDDAYVIVEALNDPRVEVAGISVVFGNAPVEDGTIVARELLGAMGSTLPVHRGAGGAGDSERGYPASDAVRGMAEALREGPLSLVAIGPLTNVASLIENHPEEVRNIERCVVVAGRSRDQHFRIGGQGGIPDFNFESDWHAGERLLRSNVPVSLTGFELSSRVAVTREHLEHVRERSSFTRTLVERSLPWLDFWTESFPSDTGFHPWDSAALALLLRPHLFVREERGWRIRHVAPDGGGEPVPWLETDKDFHGRRIEYCPGFREDGGSAFIEAMLGAIR